MLSDDAHMWRVSTWLEMERKMRVMVAGDDVSTACGIFSTLAGRGYRLEITKDGIDCIMSLSDYVPDLVIMDFHILWGGSDGVMDVMSKDAKLSSVPIVLFASVNGRRIFWEYRRIDARMTALVQTHEFLSLTDLLDSMGFASDEDAFASNRNGRVDFSYVNRSLLESDRG